MRNQAEKPVSVQSPFAIDNLFNNERFTFNITIFGRIYPSDGSESYFEPINGWNAYSSGRVLSTTTRRNNHGREMGYTNVPTMFAMTGTTNHCMFYINGDEKTATYSSMTPFGVVNYSHILYEDIIGGIVLQVVPGTARNHATGKERSKNSGITIIDDVHSIQDMDFETTPSIAAKRSNSVVIPDTERFSFLCNVSMYFSATIFQWTINGWRSIDTITQDKFGKFGGYFSLTGDEGMLYPEGISIIEIEDGFSQGAATVEFDHDVSDKTVKITVLSHTSKICDIRDLNEVGYNFPYTLCFAL
ncbi:hypothetical protein ACTUVN_003185 [Pseudomonas caspiana]